jgi:hypothetical protein
MLTCLSQAIILTLKRLFEPTDYLFVQWYNDPPPFEADALGQIVSVDEADDETSLPL